MKETMKLVFLIYAINNCYVKITRKKPKGVTINLQKKTWYYKNREYNIGNMRHCERYAKYGIIGVYDVNKINHLDNMAHHAIEATRNYRLDSC